MFEKSPWGPKTLLKITVKDHLLTNTITYIHLQMACLSEIQNYDHQLTRLLKQERAWLIEQQYSLNLDMLTIDRAKRCQLLLTGRRNFSARHTIQGWGANDQSLQQMVAYTNWT